MKRADALSYLRIAGYHADRGAFTRLYVENRVSIAAARGAYNQGRAQRAAGVRCDCSDCKVIGDARAAEAKLAAIARTRRPTEAEQAEACAAYARAAELTRK